MSYGYFSRKDRISEVEAERVADACCRQAVRYTQNPYARATFAQGEDMVAEARFFKRECRVEIGKPRPGEFDCDMLGSDHAVSRAACLRCSYHAQTRAGGRSR